MRRIRFVRAGWLLALAVAAAMPAAHAQSVGSAFTYQGELRAAGTPANAAYDFQFRLFNSASGTLQVGPTLNVAGVSVINGLFSVPLDFGPGQFAGDAQWLEVGVRPATGGVFETLVPRTAVSATPYALGAVAALANSVTGTSIVDGSVQAGDLAAGAVGTAQINTAQVQARIAAGCAAGSAIRTVAANGAVTCETPLQGPAGAADGWSRNGNAGTNPATQFIGTTDDQPLVVRANAAETARFTADGLRIGGESWQPLVELAVRSNRIATPDEGTSADILLEPRGSAGPRSGILVSGFGGIGSVGDLGFFVSQFGDGTAAETGQILLAVDGIGAGRFAGTDLALTGADAIAIGGRSNTASEEGAATIGGNRNMASGFGAATLGGDSNTASGSFAATLGGFSNCAGGGTSIAMGSGARVRIGAGTTELGLGCDGVGSSGDADGDNGTFVWADSQIGLFESTGPNQFLLRAAGGVAINTNAPAPGTALTVNGRTALGDDVAVATRGALSFGSQTRQMLDLWGEGAYGIGVQPDTQYFRSAGNFGWFQGGRHADAVLDAGAGGELLMSLTPGPVENTPIGTARAQSFVNVSDRAAKDGFAAIDPREVLGKVVALPLSRWFYRNAPDQWHIGPVAQDFFAAFSLGGDEKTISTVDADGVALAAIQGLDAKLEAERAALAADVARLGRDNAALREEAAALRRRLEAIEARLGAAR